MGLFGGLAKLAGKVVKSGLSVATGGKSDAALKIVKNVTGIGKPKAMNPNVAAAVLKYSPKVKGVSLGPAFSEGRGSAMPGLRTSRSTRSRRRSSRSTATAAARPKKRAKRSTSSKRTGRRTTVRAGSKSLPGNRTWDQVLAAEARSQGLKPVKRKKGTRKPPTGGLDLKALSVSWKAAGKPVSWQQWIKQNK